MAQAFRPAGDLIHSPPGPIVLGMERDRLPGQVQKLAATLRDEVLETLKWRFTGRDEVIDLMGIALVSGENLFLHGPPGTAKSAIVRQLSGLLQARCFDYLLTRFTEPGEIFGPFDIRRLREGELITNTEGMLPEADMVFLDELLNANSAILNNLLMVLNERVFRRGSEIRPLQTLTFISASNRLPDEESLSALFDRFLIRANCSYLAADRLQELLKTGWDHESRKSNRESESSTQAPQISTAEIRLLQQSVLSIDLDGIRECYGRVIARLRKAGVQISDRRAVRMQKLVAASALMSGRDAADPTDLWVLRHGWDTPDQESIIRGITSESVEEELRRTGKDPNRTPDPERAHPRAAGDSRPDSREISRRLVAITRSIQESSPSSSVEAWREQLAAIENEVQWIPSGPVREQLDRQLGEAWDIAETRTEPG